MTSAELLTVTFEEYLAYEERSDRRHEWVAGHAYAMTGGSERHDNLVIAIFERLLPRARADGCRPYVHHRRVRLATASYYPDVLVVCPGATEPDRQFERDLSLVVEVLSPSTETVDRREKAAAYPTAPSFRAYLLVDPDRRRIEVCTRTGDTLQWQTCISGDVVPGVELDVDELYDAVDAITRT